MTYDEAVALRARQLQGLPVHRGQLATAIETIQASKGIRPRVAKPKPPKEEAPDQETTEAAPADPEAVVRALKPWALHTSEIPDAKNMSHWPLLGGAK